MLSTQKGITRQNRRHSGNTEIPSVDNRIENLENQAKNRGFSQVIRRQNDESDFTVGGKNRMFVL